MMEFTERRLAAIVSIDVVGYSRLMGVNEAETLATLQAHRRALVDPQIDAHGGRIVKTTGDGMLLEFPSAVAAVSCSVAIQNGMAERNRTLPDAQLMRFRIGVHVGDVIVEKGDIFGDSVNIAARVEALAGPGSIALTDDAHRQVRDRLDAGWQDGGRHDVKNIARPVRIWHWQDAAPEQIPAEQETPLPLPDMPSIAVLPFDNLSGDPEQEYFVDGMTEDIITALSRFRRLFVIARNSTFTYKGKAVDIKQVGQALGVQYVLEGSVRRAGDRIRVSSQLIDTLSGGHVWAERYDRNLKDIFELQDELTGAITASIYSEVSESERQLAYKKRPTKLDVWDLYQRGMWHFYKSTKQDVAEAFRYFNQVIERSPETANAHAALAMIAFYQVMFGYAEDKTGILRFGLDEAEKAVTLDHRDGYGYYALGRICMLRNDRNASISALEKSIELNANSASSYQALGFSHYWFGEAELALPFFQRAIRLSPQDPQLWSFYLTESMTLFALERFDQAVHAATASVQHKSDEFWPYCALAFAHFVQGNFEAARSAFKRAKTLNSNLSEAYIKRSIADLHPPYLARWLETYHATRQLVSDA